MNLSEGARVSPWRLALAVLSASLTLVVGCAHEGEPDRGAAFPALLAERELLIDGYEADLLPVYLFEVDARNRMFVGQTQETSIRVFDRDGTLLGRIGRPGSGPGEFGNLYRMGFVHDTLWVSDGRLGRVSFFDSDLSLIRTEPWPRSRVASLRLGQETIGFRSAFFLYLTPDRSWHARLFNPEPPPGSDFDADPDLNTYGVVSPDSVLTVIARYPTEQRGTYVVEGDGMRAGGTYPFAIQPLYDIGPTAERSGLLVVGLDGETMGTAQVAVWDSRGDTIFSRRYPIDTTPLPQAVADSAIEARIETRRDQRAWGPDLIAAYRDGVWTPPFYPPVEDLLIGRDGSVWFRLYEPDDSVSTYRVLRPDGEPYGEVVFPGDVSIKAADLDHAWGTVSDEFDVESVVRYAVTPQP